MPTIGKCSIQNESNGNGQMLINFAACRRLVVGSTLFPPKQIHLATWRSIDGVTTNKIDHVLINARHISGLTDMRTFREANVV